MPIKEPDNLNAIGLTILMFRDIMLGLVGGAVAYLFDFSRAKREENAFRFQISSMLINMILGAFVAYMVGTLIAQDTTGRDAIVGISGVTSYQILLVAESRFVTWIVKKMTGETMDGNVKNSEDKQKDKK